MDLAASKTDFSSAFAAAFLVILARKVIAIVMWKFNALIEIRLRTRKFSKSRICLSGFFYICDYLDITARDFFDDGNEYPEQLRAVFQDMQKLSPEQLQNIHAIVKGLLR